MDDQLALNHQRKPASAAETGCAMAIVLFILAVVGIPMAILLLNDYGKKRGCGRGCATCGNRDICYRNKKKNTKT